MLIPRNYDRNDRLQMAESRWTHPSNGRETPPDELFLVHHYDQPPPPDRLEVTLPDLSQHEVSPQQVREACERVDVTAVLECAGNGRGLRRKRTPGTQFGIGMYGQTSWSGARLRDVLALVGGVASSWSSAHVLAADEGTAQPEDIHARFGKGLSREKALHPDTLLAWAAGGSALAPEHGAPLRLVVPGWYGIWWVKWPSKVWLSADNFTGFWQNERYTYQDENGAVHDLVTEIQPRAIVLSPQDGEIRTASGVASGIAWTGPAGLAAVEVSTDDGTTWGPAEVEEPTAPWRWRRWRAELSEGLPRGLRRIAARATDRAGTVQDWEPRWNRLGYANNGIHTVTIDLAPAGPRQGSELH